MPRPWEGTVRVFLPAWLSMVAVAVIGLALNWEWVSVWMLLTFAVVGLIALARYNRYLKRKHGATR